jgi:nitrogen fixation protein
MDFLNSDSPIDDLTGDYEKILKVINSCVTLEQFEVAVSYVELFKRKYEQEDSFLDVLSTSLLGKKMSLKNGWENKK